MWLRRALRATELGVRCLAVAACVGPEPLVATSPDTDAGAGAAPEASGAAVSDDAGVRLRTSFCEPPATAALACSAAEVRVVEDSYWAAWGHLEPRGVIDGDEGWCQPRVPREKRSYAALMQSHRWYLSTATREQRIVIIQAAYEAVFGRAATDDEIRAVDPSRQVIFVDLAKRLAEDAVRAGIACDHSLPWEASGKTVLRVCWPYRLACAP